MTTEKLTPPRKNRASKSNPTPPEPPKSLPAYTGMTLIPWEEIRRCTSVAKLRGNVGMIKAFYESLLNEALFDDRGAWSLDTKRFFDPHH